MKPIDSLTDDEFAALLRRAVALPDAPEPLVQAAMRLWREPSPGPLATVRALAERIVGSLKFDSWASAGLAGVRSVPSETRQLLFSANGRDIDLRLSPAGERFALRGQLLGPDESGTIELVGAAVEGGPAARHTAAVDKLGEFRVDDIAPGTYTLVLHVPQAEIELPPLEVGKRA